jgi:hypothetical protein
MWQDAETSTDNSRNGSDYPYVLHHLGYFPFKEEGTEKETGEERWRGERKKLSKVRKQRAKEINK